MVMRWPAGSTLALVNENVTGAVFVLNATASATAKLIETAETEPVELEIKAELPFAGSSTVVDIVSPLVC